MLRRSIGWTLGISMMALSLPLAAQEAPSAPQEADQRGAASPEVPPSDQSASEPPASDEAASDEAASDEAASGETTPEPPAPAKGTREYLVALVQDGAQLYDAGSYEQAIAKLREAYAIKPSPTIGLVLAHSYRDDHQLGNALDAYRLVAASSLPRDAHPKLVEAVEQAKEQLEHLQGRIVRLTLDVSGPDEFTVSFNGEQVRPHRSGAYVLRPGAYDVTIEAVGFKTNEFDFIAQPGSQPTQRVELKPVAAQAPDRSPTESVPARKKAAPAPESTRTPEPPPAPPAKRTKVYKTLGTTSLGLGLAGVMAGGGLFLWAMTEDQKTVEFCSDNLCSPEAQPHLQSARDAAFGATIAFSVAGGLAATGIGLLVYDGVRNRQVEADQMALSEVRILPLPAGMAISGSF